MGKIRSKNLVENKKGVGHIVVLLFLVGIPLLVVVVLAVTGRIKIPGLSRGPQVDVKEAYSNPFNKETQYVNPFQEYKNPFNNL